MITNSLTLDMLKPVGSPPVIHANCGENNARNLRITMICGGVGWAAPQNCNIIVSYMRQDGTGGYYDTVGENDAVSLNAARTVATVLIHEAVMAVAGQVAMDLTFLEENGQTISFRWILEVHDTAAVGSENAEDVRSLNCLSDIRAALQALRQLVPYHSVAPDVVPTRGQDEVELTTQGIVQATGYETVLRPGDYIVDIDSGAIAVITEWNGQHMMAIGTGDRFAF